LQIWGSISWVGGQICVQGPEGDQNQVPPGWQKISRVFSWFLVIFSSFQSIAEMVSWIFQFLGTWKNYEKSGKYSRNFLSKGNTWFQSLSGFWIQICPPTHEIDPDICNRSKNVKIHKI